MILRNLALVFPTALALAACSNADESTDRHNAMLLSSAQAAADPDDCLLMVWSSQEERNVEFDRENDVADGGAISCATGTSASQFDAAITALRDAAASGNKLRILEEVGLPLLYIDADGERREIEERAEIERVFDEIFDASMLDVLQKLDLKRMTVEKDQGGFFELGALWLVVDESGGRPRLVTVNREALDEAAEAARREGTRNRGEPVPLER